MSDIIAVFSPDAPADTWTLRVAFGHSAFRLPGLDAGAQIGRLRRPNLDDLNARMLNAHGGFMMRVRPAGEIEISASDRSAVVLHDWLLSIIAETTGA